MTGYATQRKSKNVTFDPNLVSIILYNSCTVEGTICTWNASFTQSVIYVNEVTELLEFGMNKRLVFLKLLCDSNLVTSIIKQLNTILEPDQKITPNGRMVRETKLKAVEKEEKEIVKKLDEWDKLTHPEDYETGKLFLLNFLGIDEDIVKKAIKLHQDHLKGNALIRNKNRKFREFGVKHLINLDDSSESLKEEESKKMHRKIERMLKMKPKYGELISDDYLV